MPASSGQESERLDVRSYFRPIWRRKFLILLIAVVAGAVVFLLTNSETKKYRTVTDVYVQTAYPVLSNTVGGGGGGISPSTDQLGDVAQLIASASVTADVQKRIGEAPSAVGTVATAPSSTSDFVTILATSGSAAGARRLANGYAQAYLASRRASLISQARAAIAAAEATLKSTSNRAERQTVLDNIQGFREALLDPNVGATQPAAAALPTGPYSPKPKTDTVFAVVLGLALGILLAYGLELLDVSINGPSELEELFSRPVLAVLPRVPDASPFSEDLPAVPEEFIEPLRMLRFQLRLGPEVGEPKAILIISGVQDEGKSTLIRDLALTYAQAGQRVLVIDGDVRKQSLSDMFRVKPTRGFVDVLLDGTSLGDVVEPVVTPTAAGGAIDLLVSGASGRESVNLLASPQMRELLADAGDAYDAVFIDTAPLLMVADSTPLLPSVDAVLVVVRLGLVTRQSARRLAETLRRLDVVPRGVIVNGQDSREADALSYAYEDDGRIGARQAAKLTRAQDA